MDGILPEGFELELPAPKLKIGDLKPATSQYAQQMQAIFGAVREGLYGWADDNSSYLQEHIADTVSMVENYTTALTAKGWSFSAALEHVHATIAEVMTRFDQQVSKFMTDSIVAATQSISRGCKSASCRARRHTSSTASVCMREAISGTTPPYFACSAAEEIIRLESIFLPRRTAHAVSSQLDSIPKMTGSGLISHFEISYIAKTLIYRII